MVTSDEQFFGGTVEFFCGERWLRTPYKNWPVRMPMGITESSCLCCWEIQCKSVIVYSSENTVLPRADHYNAMHTTMTVNNRYIPRKFLLSLIIPHYSEKVPDAVWPLARMDKLTLLQFLRVIGKGRQDVLTPPGWMTYHTTSSVWKMPPSWHWTDHSGGYWQQVELHTQLQAGQGWSNTKSNQIWQMRVRIW